MKRIFIWFVFLPFLTQAQNISLSQCVEAAKTNWPTFKKEMSIEKQKQVINLIHDKQNLPKLLLSGQATYQSETATFPDIPIPSLSNLFPELPLDNYNVEAIINQTIWDGGMLKAKKAVQIFAKDLELKKNAIDTYALTGKINQLYFNYLTLYQKEEILKISENELDKNIATLKVAVVNGVLLQSDIDNLISEKLKLAKTMLDIEAGKYQIIKALNIITGLQIPSDAKFEMPQVLTGINTARPELDLFDAQADYLKLNEAQYAVNRKPKFIGFAKLGYGRPGFDMFHTDLHSYYLIGAKFSWNIWDWNLLKAQKHLIKIQQDVIAENKNLFNKQIDLKLTAYQQDINKIIKQITIDKKIESLRNSIYKSAKSKYDVGNLLTTEYLKAFNELKRARLAIRLDELKLLQAKINYAYTQGQNF